MRTRIFCAVMTVMLVLTMLPAAAVAEEVMVPEEALRAAEIAFTQRETEIGAERVNVGVDMVYNPGLVTATIPVVWDNDVLHLVDVEPSEDILSNGWIGMSMDEYESNGKYYLAWDNDLAEADFTTEVGCLAELTFEIVDPSVDTNTTLDFDMEDPIANVMNFAMEDLRETITVVANDGAITVAAAEGGEDPVEADAVITVVNTKAKAGESVDVQFTFEGEHGFGGMAFDVFYDKDKLTLTGVTSDVGFVYTKVEKCDGKCNFQYAGTENLNDLDNFLTMTFSVAEGVEDGDIEISVDMIGGSQFYYDEDDNEIDFTVETVSGNVTIYSYIPGDATGDEIVNNRDAARILQYLANWDVEIVLEACDTTGDGIVNNRDAARILQYLAGWDVEIHS